VDGRADRQRDDRHLGERPARHEEALVEVVEGPLPLEAVDAQLDGRVWLPALHVGQGLLTVEEEKGHDDGGDREERR